MFASFLCAVGFHRRGPKYHQVMVWHHGEYPWEAWTHMCHAYKKSECTRCGLPSRRKRRMCTGPKYQGPRQTDQGYDFSNVPKENMSLFI